MLSTELIGSEPGSGMIRLAELVVPATPWQRST